MSVVYIVNGNPGSGHKIYAHNFFSEQARLLNVLSDQSRVTMTTPQKIICGDCLLLLQYDTDDLDDPILQSYSLIVVQTNYITQQEVDTFERYFDKVFVKYFKNDIPVIRHNNQFGVTINHSSEEIICENIEYLDPIVYSDFQICSFLITNSARVFIDHYDEQKLMETVVSVHFFIPLITMSKYFYETYDIPLNMFPDLGNETHEKYLSLKYIFDKLYPYLKPHIKSVEEFRNQLERS